MRLITTTETQSLLKCHRNTVYNLAKKGKLKAYRDYRDYLLFSVDEVLLVRDERKKIRASEDGSPK